MQEMVENSIDELDTLKEKDIGMALGEELDFDDMSDQTDDMSDQTDDMSDQTDDMLDQTIDEEENEQELIQEVETETVSNEVENSKIDTGEGADLISRLSGMDPVALRKLLAGAQININITFPKD